MKGGGRRVRGEDVVIKAGLKVMPLLAVMMEEGIVNQGMYASSRNWKRQGYRVDSFCRHLDFSLLLKSVLF